MLLVHTSPSSRQPAGAVQAKKGGAGETRAALALDVASFDKVQCWKHFGLCVVGLDASDTSMLAVCLLVFNGSVHHHSQTGVPMQ